MDFISYNIQTVVAKLCPEEEIIERPEGMPPLPIRTYDSISLMEKFLDDKKHRRALVSYMNQLT